MRPGARAGPVARMVAPLLAGLLAAACAALPRDTATVRAGEDPTRLAIQIAEHIDACWFAPEEEAFAGYRPVAELDSYAGRPRILVVAASDPGGAPRLVIQVGPDGSGSSVNLSGPLLAEEQGPRIERDIARWTSGAEAC